MWGGLLGGSAPPKNPSKLLLLDSLSWLLLRLPPPQIGGVLRALLGGGHPKNGCPPRVVALLHEDLHPPSLLGALGGLAATQLRLGGAPPPQKLLGGHPGTPQHRVLSIRSRPRRGGPCETVEAFTPLPDGSLGPPPVLGAPPRAAPPPRGFGGPRPPPAPPLTFRLRLSPAERAARAAAPPPYLHRPSSLLQPLPPPEDEDPDDDLDV
ncbi:elongator complex protein 5-like isoform X3 [Phaenicophaeus curvirostris]|uniref:elongator complex protein 5-like isoform X3 n=1 Tax=Phaenicophaeus curvirostris TaxID=33595 RepID=UPI0037F0A442